MSNTGISAGDFTYIYNDFKRTVSYKVNSKTTDPLTGDETSTFAAASNVDVIFFEEDVRYLFDKSGLLQAGDAYIMAPTTQGIKRYDQFTIGGKTFYIENVIRRLVTTVVMHDFATCFLVTA